MEAAEAAEAAEAPGAAGGVAAVAAAAAVAETVESPASSEAAVAVEVEAAELWCATMLRSKRNTWDTAIGSSSGRWRALRRGPGSGAPWTESPRSTRRPMVWR